MALFSVIPAADAPITKDFTKIILPDGTVEVVRKITYIDPKTVVPVWTSGELIDLVELDR